MKKRTSMIIMTAIACIAASNALTYAAEQDYTVYSFEDGIPSFNRPGGASVEKVDGALGSTGAMRVILSGTDNNKNNGSAQMPVYLEKGKEYRVSFYYKEESGGSITTIKPLFFDADKKYKFLDSITKDDMVSIGDGWYYYETTYTPDMVSGNVAHTDGEGTFELRMTRSNSDDSSAYVLDDVKIEPLSKEGYRNVLVDEDFNSGTMNTFTVATSKSSAEIKLKDGEDYYAEVTGTDAQTGIRNNDKNLFDIYSGKKYVLSFDIMGCDDQTDGAKVMWHINGFNYAVNSDDIKISKDTWKSYSAVITPATDISDTYIRPQLGSSKGANGTFALDNIRLEEMVPQVNDISYTGDLKAGAVLTAHIAADEGMTKYVYKVMTSPDNINYSVAASGVSDSESIDYTIRENDAGKYIRLEVTGCDDQYSYNTIEKDAGIVADSEQTNSMSFTSGLGTTVTAEFTQYDHDSAVAFIALYGSDGRLVGISNETLQRGITKSFSATASETPASAKIVMFDSIDNLNQIIEEKTLK